MVAQEYKLAPQEVKEWSLKDLVDVVSDILTKNDYEAYAYYFPDN